MTGPTWSARLACTAAGAGCSNSPVSDEVGGVCGAAAAASATARGASAWERSHDQAPAEMLSAEQCTSCPVFDSVRLYMYVRQGNA